MKTKDDKSPLASDLPDDWDPPENERKFFRETTKGDLGYLVKRGGKTMVRLDRPMEEVILPFRKNKWAPDVKHRPLGKFQVAQVAFEADRKLCTALGLHEKARRDWMSLTDEQRMLWAERGPKDRPERSRLWVGVMKALGPYSS